MAPYSRFKMSHPPRVFPTTSFILPALETLKVQIRLTASDPCRAVMRMLHELDHLPSHQVLYPTHIHVLTLTISDYLVSCSDRVSLRSAI